MCYIWHEFPESSFPRASLSLGVSCLVSPGQLRTCFRSQSRVQSLPGERRAGDRTLALTQWFTGRCSELSVVSSPPVTNYPSTRLSPTPIWHEREVSGVREHSDYVIWPNYQAFKRNLNDGVILLDWQLKFISRSFKFPNSRISICKQQFSTLFY